MKASIFFSCVLHLALFAALVFSRTTPRRFEGYPTVLPVEIVDLKPVSFKAPEVEKIAPKRRRALPQPKELKGVTVEKAKIETEEPEERPRKQVEKPEKSDKGKSLAKGEKVRLDVKEFPFSYYLALLQSRINANWEPPFGVAGRVVVFFKIQRNGHLTNVLLELKSGDFLLDRAAMRAVTLADPLPPLPYDFSEPALGVHFEFEQARN